VYSLSFAALIFSGDAGHRKGNFAAAASTRFI
jgi:hypothetical protein